MQKALFTLHGDTFDLPTEKAEIVATSDRLGPALIIAAPCWTLRIRFDAKEVAPIALKWLDFSSTRKQEETP